MIETVPPVRVSWKGKLMHTVALNMNESDIGHVSIAAEREMPRNPICSGRRQGLELGP